LWQQARVASRESYERPAGACRMQVGKAQPSGACAAFLKSSEKSQQEWELERRFRAFEASF